MKLELEDVTAIENVDADAVHRALHSLDGETNSFAILSETEMTYIQGGRDAEGRWTVEYQQGSVKDHYRAKGNLATHEAVNLFLAYLRRSHDWKTMCEWENSGY